MRNSATYSRTPQIGDSYLRIYPEIKNAAMINQVKCRKTSIPANRKRRIVPPRIRVIPPKSRSLQTANRPPSKNCRLSVVSRGFAEVRALRAAKRLQRRVLKRQVLLRRFRRDQQAHRDHGRLEETMTFEKCLRLNFRPVGQESDPEKIF